MRCYVRSLSCHLQCESVPHVACHYNIVWDAASGHVISRSIMSHEVMWHLTLMNPTTLSSYPNKLPSSRNTFTSPSPLPCHLIHQSPHLPLSLSFSLLGDSMSTSAALSSSPLAPSSSSSAHTGMRKSHSRLSVNMGTGAGHILSCVRVGVREKVLCVREREYVSVCPSICQS